MHEIKIKPDCSFSCFNTGEEEEQQEEEAKPGKGVGTRKYSCCSLL